MTDSTFYAELFKEYNLPVEAMERIKAAIEKRVSDGFVRKELYREKLEALKAALEACSTANEALSTAQAEAEAHKRDCERVSAEYQGYAENQQALVHYAQKDEAVSRALEADGANPVFINLLKKGIDLAAATLTGDGDRLQIAGWDEISKGLKAAYPEAFGLVKTLRADVATPPPSHGNERNPWLEDYKSLGEQGRLYRENPALARDLAAMAGKRIY
jgi:hypothetical protein